LDLDGTLCFSSQFSKKQKFKRVSFVPPDHFERLNTEKKMLENKSEIDEENYMISKVSLEVTHTRNVKERVRRHLARNIILRIKKLQDLLFHRTKYSSSEKGRVSCQGYGEETRRALELILASRPFLTRK
jgi:CRISPR/Cas system CSM-associated protein Csm4 (group 5 of RAMP superfamily)